MVSNVLVVVCWPKKSFIYMANSAEMIEFIWDSWTELWKKKEKKNQVRAHVKKRWPGVKVNIVLNWSVT